MRIFKIINDNMLISIFIFYILSIIASVYVNDIIGIGNLNEQILDIKDTYPKWKIIIYNIGDIIPVIILAIGLYSGHFLTHSPRLKGGGILDTQEWRKNDNAKS